jgi:hypothetical protein
MDNGLSAHTWFVPHPPADSPRFEPHPRPVRDQSHAGVVVTDAPAVHDPGLDTVGPATTLTEPPPVLQLGPSAVVQAGPPAVPQLLTQTLSL